MGSFSTIEMVLVAAVVVLVFGAGWIPKIARKAGQNKVHVERARAEFEKTKEAVNAPVKSVTDAVSKVDKTLNTKPADLVKKLAEPAAAAGTVGAVASQAADSAADAVTATEAAETVADVAAETDQKD